MGPMDLRKDEIPWLKVAQDIMDGVYDKTDSSTIESLTIGLRSIRHPLCRQALERLGKIKPIAYKPREV